MKGATDVKDLSVMTMDKLIEVKGPTGGIGAKKVFQCESCGKLFKKKYNMKIHMRNHTGETPYVCDAEGCGLRFKWRSSLINHKRYHQPPEVQRPSGDIHQQAVEMERSDVFSLMSKPALPHIAGKPVTEDASHDRVWGPDMYFGSGNGVNEPAKSTVPDLNALRATLHTNNAISYYSNIGKTHSENEIRDFDGLTHESDFLSSVPPQERVPRQVEIPSDSQSQSYITRSVLDCMRME